MTIETIALDIFQQVFFFVYTNFRESIAPKYKQHTSLLSYLETLLVVQFFLQLFYMQEYFLCSLQAISVFVTRYFTSKNGQKKTSLFYQNIFYEVVVPNTWHFGGGDVYTYLLCTCSNSLKEEEEDRPSILTWVQQVLRELGELCFIQFAHIPLHTSFNFVFCTTQQQPLLVVVLLTGLLA